MRPLLRLAILACCILAGCHTQVPVTADALVGDYIYKSEDPGDRATDHNLDHLTLRSNGKYDLVQGGATKAKTEMLGAWTISMDRSGVPMVLLDHAGYPVWADGKEIRLLIDNDTGIW